MQTNPRTSNLSEIKISYTSKVKNSERTKLISSKDAERVLRNIWGSDIELRERFYILLLNRGNKLIGWYKVSEGGLIGTVVDTRLIFSVALKSLACYVILAHNHPSQNLQPSEADIRLTKELEQAGNIWKSEFWTI